MNVDDEAEMDRILAHADIIISDSSPELLGAIRARLRQFPLHAQRGWHSGKQQLSANRRGLLTRVLPVFHMATRLDVKCCHVQHFSICTCSLDDQRKPSRRSKTILVIVCITLAVLPSLILNGNLSLGV